MGKLEDAFNGRIKDKYGVEKLETESEPRFSIDMVDDSQNQTAPNYHKQFMKVVEDKYKMGGRLHMAGHLGYRLEQTLEDLSRDTARANATGFKLATASTKFQGKPVRLFFEISI